MGVVSLCCVSIICCGVLGVVVVGPGCNGLGVVGGGCCDCCCCCNEGGCAAGVVGGGSIDLGANFVDFKKAGFLNLD